MNFKNIAVYFKFTKSQRTGVLILFAIIVVFQLAYFFVNIDSIEKESPEKQKWLSVQSEIDSLNRSKQKLVVKTYSFNPNFISDYKGYRLGMSVPEIDRLLAFRKENKYVNSAKEFQDVTMVSDSLLTVLAPYFKFPDWVINKSTNKKYLNYEEKAFGQKEKIVVADINNAKQEDLTKIFGIGEVLSLRILKLKESLGEFVSMEQMKDVWGLSPEVITNLNMHYKIFAFPNIKKLDINNASVKEMAQFPYFRYALAKQIVTYRSMNGDIKNIEDLTKIKDFPVEKSNIIGLYLTFN
ncbi:ComEA family DNA-binding protein [Flavobacterium sp. W22_SRS_FP1]|uniref:ComEA family DNA-binding protein n=1 Tax=Flavobacterium sp. W22_SRS_FP1 TaxID=3240276 RepID=UPI003F8E9BB8